MVTVAVLVGSLRKASINKRLAKAFEKIGHDIIKFDIIPLENVPFYNQDIEGNPPESVVNLRNSIKAADGVLFISPEYNRSITAVLKNAIDWASRPYGKNSISGKPCATAGLSPGAIGTAVMQGHLRTILVMLDMPVMGQPEMYLGNGMDLIDENGNVSNEGTAKFFRSFLEKFASFVAKEK